MDSTSKIVHGIYIHIIHIYRYIKIIYNMSYLTGRGLCIHPPLYLYPQRLHAPPSVCSLPLNRAIVSTRTSLAGSHVRSVSGTHLLSTDPTLSKSLGAASEKRGVIVHPLYCPLEMRHGYELRPGRDPQLKYWAALPQGLPDELRITVDNRCHGCLDAEAAAV